MAKKNADTQSKTETNETLVLTPEQLEIQEIDAQIKALREKKKETKEAQKGEKKAKELKGVMISFVNKAGETITGLGNKYYVVRQDGKLHYKAEDAVHLMTEDEIAEYKLAQA